MYCSQVPDTFVSDFKIMFVNQVHFQHQSCFPESLHQQPKPLHLHSQKNQCKRKEALTVAKGILFAHFFWHFQFLQNMETINLPFVALTTTSPLTFPLFPNNVVNCFAFLGRLCSRVGTLAVQSLTECMTRLYPGAVQIWKIPISDFLFPRALFLQGYQGHEIQKGHCWEQPQKKGRESWECLKSIPRPTFAPAPNKIVWAESSSRCAWGGVTPPLPGSSVTSDTAGPDQPWGIVSPGTLESLNLAGARGGASLSSRCGLTQNSHPPRWRPKSWIKQRVDPPLLQPLRVAASGWPSGKRTMPSSRMSMTCATRRWLSGWRMLRR